MNFLIGRGGGVSNPKYFLIFIFQLSGAEFHPPLPSQGLAYLRLLAFTYGTVQY